MVTSDYLKMTMTLFYKLLPLSALLLFQLMLVNGADMQVESSMAATSLKTLMLTML